MQTRSHRGRRASLRLAQWSAVAAFASAACGGGGGAPATQMPGDATLDTTSTRPELDGAADANAMTAADAAGDEAESADVGADDGGLEGGVAETGTGMI